MTQKEIYMQRARLFSEGKCPVCGKEADFRHTGTRQEGSIKMRTMQCPHCQSAFRVRVQVEVFFSKVTKEGTGA
jgi:hypothetical protein